MSNLYIDNYIIETPILDIIYDIKDILGSSKLCDIIPKEDEVKLTCPNDEHSGANEHDPDCHVLLEEKDGFPKGTFNCFACGAKGSFAHFVALCFSSSDDYAKKWLIKNYGTLAVETVEVDDFISFRHNKKTTNYLDKSILENQTYQNWCPYLAQRKLSRDICEKFQVKYDSKNRQVLFPVFDENGNLLMIPKRSIDTKIFYMDADKEKPVYGLNVIKRNNVKKCMLVEGPIDMLTCWTQGVPAIAILGTPSDSQVELINSSGLTSIYIATDNDSAGEKFAKYLNKNIKNTIIKTKVELPQNRKDVNDLTDAEWEILRQKYNF